MIPKVKFHFNESGDVIVTGHSDELSSVIATPYAKEASINNRVVMNSRCSIECNEIPDDFLIKLLLYLNRHCPRLAENNFQYFIQLRWMITEARTWLKTENLSRIDKILEDMLTSE